MAISGGFLARGRCPTFEERIASGIKGDERYWKFFDRNVNAFDQRLKEEFGKACSKRSKSSKLRINGKKDGNRNAKPFIGPEYDRN